MQKYYCIDCKKEVCDYRIKRCRKCNNVYMSKKFKGEKHPFYGKHHTIKTKAKLRKLRIEKGLSKGRKNGMFGVHRFGKKAPGYIDGRTNNQHFCKDCSVKISVNNWRTGLNKCRKCSKNKKSSVKHHVDLNRRNNRKNNILKLKARKHISLHHRAYDYLVKIGKVRQYIKWFLKTYRGNKKR